MPFDTMTTRMKEVANGSLRFCRQQFGNTGLTIEKEIAVPIYWRPSFWMRQTSAQIVAVEVSEILFPSLLRGAAHDVRQHPLPISMIVACPLEVFVADAKQTEVNKLRSNGIGLITVDDQGVSRFQHKCPSIAQHISEEEFNGALAGLSQKQKVAFRAAFETYQANVGQGLQEAGQIIEAMIVSLGAASAKAGYVGNGINGKSAAHIIDDLYVLQDRQRNFNQHRAILGAARDFVNQYRNSASHPARTAGQAIAKIRGCRAGFLESIGVARRLRDVFTDKGFSFRLHVV